MPAPKFAKPWHGVPRDQIEWHPTVNAAACIGCGTCVTGCSRLVYRFDFDAKKAVVVDGFAPPDELPIYAAINRSALSFAGRDAYIAGPRKTTTLAADALRKRGVEPRKIKVDSYGN